MTVGQLSEARQYLMQEKSQPDAFALAVFTHQVHAIIPITGADQGQTVFASLEPSHDRLHTVVIQSAGLCPIAPANRNKNLPRALRDDLQERRRIRPALRYHRC